INELLIDQKSGCCECLPRLKLCYQPWLDLWVARQKVIESIDKGLAQFSLATTDSIIFSLRQTGYLERPIQHVISKCSFAVNFRSPPSSADERVLDLPEVVFGLGVDISKNAAHIRRPVDVRNAVAVTIDRN